MIGAEMPLAAQEFLRRQPFAVLSSVDAQGRVWVSILTGRPGFMRATDEHTVAIEGLPLSHDPLRENLQADPNIGMLVIEFATRKRMRINGKGELRDDGVVIYAEQVYSNCPKYIQAREWEFAQTVATPAMVQRNDVLNAAQQVWIQQADTFFIGSFYPDGGTDASHRGGNPGFVKIVDEKTLLWPDYIGNNMFNTLGNITAYPRAGLLFVDFANGRTLQLTGTAKIIWDAPANFPGAQRLVEFAVNEVVETANALPLQWFFQGYSPYNPG
ncbi:MAG: pyridoxamine 5'-phosphate oxidase family protein [Gammaproteobacteria bacterium]|nr:pyridoxamine 5'-phosphate oxidase family protein [Gammaproteobacteria bacterium]